jgi:hypothetical protein
MVLETFFRSERLACLVLVTAVLACQSSDLTLPDDGLPARLKPLSGDGQRGTVGSDLPDPLVVQVLDAAGRPAGQIPLRFTSQVPDAQIPATAVTDDSGTAEVRVRLGTTEGTQRFEAQVASAAELRTTFALTAVAERPSDEGGGGDAGGGGEGNGNGGNNGSGEGHGGGNGHGSGKDDGGHGDHDHGHGHGDHHGDSGDGPGEDPGHGHGQDKD